MYLPARATAPPYHQAQILFFSRARRLGAVRRNFITLFAPSSSVPLIGYHSATVEFTMRGPLFAVILSIHAVPAVLGLSQSCRQILHFFWMFY